LITLRFAQDDSRDIWQNDIKDKAKMQ